MKLCIILASTVFGYPNNGYGDNENENLSGGNNADHDGKSCMTCTGTSKADCEVRDKTKETKSLL